MYCKLQMYRILYSSILPTDQQNWFEDLASNRPTFYLTLDISPARRLTLLFIMGTLLSLFNMCCYLHPDLNITVKKYAVFVDIHGYASGRTCST